MPHSPSRHRPAPSTTRWLLACLPGIAIAAVLACTALFDALMPDGAPRGRLWLLALGAAALLVPPCWLLARRLGAAMAPPQQAEGPLAEVQALRQALADLEHRNQQTTAILRHAPDAFIGLDEHGRIAAWNLESERLFGWPREAAIGRSLIELLTPAADRPAQLARWSALKRQPIEAPQVINRFDVLALHHDGHTIPVHVSVAALATATGFTTYAFVHDISERQRAERRLAESEHRLRLVASNTPALMLHVDTGLRFTFANARARDWFPTLDNQLAGKTIPEVMGEATFRQVEPELRRALAGEAVSFERNIERGGEQRHYLVHYKPDIGDDGQVQGIYGTAIDITARRQAEVAMLASEQRLRDIANNVPAMIAYFDADLRCRFANAQSLAISGIPLDHVMGTPLHEVLGSRYTAYLPHVQRALAGERTSFEGHQQSGERRLDVQTHFMPDVAGDGRVVGFYVLAYDQTAQKTAERRSADTAHRLRTITDNLPVLIAYIDRQERYQFCNGTFKTWMGVDPAALIGRSIADTMSPQDYQHRQPLLQRALAGERTEFELDTVQLGIRRHLQTICIPDVAPDGSVAGLYALVSDVAAMKRAEAQLAIMANTDVLTGLPNRRSLDLRLTEALARARRSGHAMALLYLDLDRFKAINDSLGHAAGDEVLKVFAQRLRASVRETDTVARLAGDEFIVLLENLLTPDEPQFIARKIIAAVNRPVTLERSALDIGTSIGIAYSASGTVAPHQLLASADKALYEAKDAGRNTFRWAQA